MTTADVMAALQPIWSTKNETAQRVRRRIGAVMRWAIAQGYRSDNPAGDAVTAALPKRPRQIRHFPALPHGEVGAALAGVRVSQAWTGTKLAFELLVLTAARSGGGAPGDVGGVRPGRPGVDDPRRPDEGRRDLSAVRSNPDHGRWPDVYGRL